MIVSGVGSVSYRGQGSFTRGMGRRTRRVHDAADDKAADGAAGEVEGRALLHAEVPHESPLGEEVCGQLDGAAEAGADHGGADAAVEAREALGAVDGGEAVHGVLVVVLGADGQEGREALQAGLDEEEGAAHGGADDAGAGAAEHVDAQVLRLAVLEDEGGEAVAHGLVEAEAAAVEEDLVDVGAADAAVDALEALVLDDDAHALERSAVLVRLVALVLELALELHAVRRMAVSAPVGRVPLGRGWGREAWYEPNLDRLEGVRRGHGAAGGNAAGDEGAVGMVSSGHAPARDRVRLPSCRGHFFGASSPVTAGSVYLRRERKRLDGGKVDCWSAEENGRARRKVGPEPEDVSHPARAELRRRKMTMDASGQRRPTMKDRTQDGAHSEEDQDLR